MAKEVSFRALFILAFALITISVFSTTLILNHTSPSSITGRVSGIAQVNVTSMVMISLPVNFVNFGQIGPGSSDDTEDDDPAPFLVQNDGTVIINITIERDNSSTPLFEGTGGGDNTTSFQFKADQSSEHNGFVPGQSQMTWANVPGTTPVLVIGSLKYADAHDSAEIDLKIDVPADEPPGLKSETINFIATQS